MPRMSYYRSTIQCFFFYHPESVAVDARDTSGVQAKTAKEIMEWIRTSEHLWAPADDTPPVLSLTGVSRWCKLLSCSEAGGLQATFRNTGKRGRPERQYILLRNVEG